MNANETSTETLSIDNGIIRERVTFRDGRSHVQYRPLSTAKDIAARIEVAAVAEATRLCDNAFAGIERIKGMPFMSSMPAMLARAKRYQIEEFRPESARILRMVSDVHPSWEMASREEWLAGVNLFCAAGIAEVERRFMAVP